MNDEFIEKVGKGKEAVFTGTVSYTCICPTCERDVSICEAYMNVTWYRNLHSKLKFEKLKVKREATARIVVEFVSLAVCLAALLFAAV